MINIWHLDFIFPPFDAKWLKRGIKYSHRLRNLEYLSSKGMNKDPLSVFLI